MGSDIMVHIQKEKLILGIVFILLLLLIFVVFLVRADYAPTIVQTGTVKGVITYGPTNPLGSDCSALSSNIGINFVATDGKTYTADTNKYGVYTINLPVGTYTMKFPVDKNGNPGTYVIRETQTVNVVTNKTITESGCWFTGIV
jgi:hypothetical protein